jgi:hypothetical protein
MNILQIAKSAANMCAVQEPTTLVNPTTQNDQLFASVVQSTLDSLMRSCDWQTLEREAVLYTNDGQKTYNLDNIAPDIYSIISGSLWDKGSMRSVIGGITQESWRQHKQYHIPVIDIYFKIQNNQIVFLKNPSCLEIHFAYRSNAVVLDEKTGEPKTAITKDTDIPVFDEYLVKLGIMWRWLKRSGMDYAEEYDEYVHELNKSYALAKSPSEINLAYVEGEITLNEGIIADVYAENKCE